MCVYFSKRNLFVWFDRNRKRVSELEGGDCRERMKLWKLNYMCEFESFMEMMA